MDFKNLVRIGHVSSVDEAKGTVRVIVDDQQEIVTDDLPLLSFEYYMPSVGDLVLCIFLGNGISKGFCLSKYFSDVNPPPVTDANIYYKDLFGDAFIKYDKISKTMTIQADNIAVVGDISITGDVTVTGAISATGNVSSDGNITATGNLSATGTVHGSNI